MDRSAGFFRSRTEYASTTKEEENEGSSEVVCLSLALIVFCLLLGITHWKRELLFGKDKLKETQEVVKEGVEKSDRRSLLPQLIRTSFVFVFSFRGVQFLSLPPPAVRPTSPAHRSYVYNTVRESIQLPATSLWNDAAFNSNKASSGLSWLHGRLLDLCRCSHHMDGASTPVLRSALLLLSPSIGQSVVRVP